MKPRPFLLAGTAALLAAPAAAQVSDFRLQPAPTPTPAIIGPPPDTPAPRPSPTPTPTIAAPPTTPRSTLPPVATPSITLPPVATPTPAQRPTASPPTPRPTLAASRAATPAAIPTTTPSLAPNLGATATTAPRSSVTGSAVGAPKEPPTSWWPWIIAAFFLGGATFACLWWLRRRIGPVGALIVPEIERPRVSPTPPQAPEPSPEPIAAGPRAAAVPAASSAEAHPLHIAIELRKLTLTLMNATLGYRLTLTNAGPGPLADIAVAADLIGAHGSLPREVLLAGPQTELPISHRLASLAVGKSGVVAGEVRIPLNQLRPIAQGRAQLFVPLARFRIAAEGQEPRCFTLVAGQPSPSGNGSIQAVRLDHGPRVYEGLAGRAF